MYNYKAKIVRWIDGDTVLLDIDLGFHIVRQERIRLARINTPEINSSKPTYVRKARHARAVANKVCPAGAEVIVDTKKIDMYARYIAEIEYNGVNISDYLIKDGCAEEVEF